MWRNGVTFCQSSHLVTYKLMLPLYPNTFWKDCDGFWTEWMKRFTTSVQSCGKFRCTCVMTRRTCVFTFRSQPGHWPRSTSGTKPAAKIKFWNCSTSKLKKNSLTLEMPSMIVTWGFVEDAVDDRHDEAAIPQHSVHCQTLKNCWRILLEEAAPWSPKSKFKWTPHCHCKGQDGRQSDPK